ncbi:MAG: cation:proton antiporter [Candidatus Sumerlaeaceae bacterium]
MNRKLRALLIAGFVALVYFVLGVGRAVPEKVAEHTTGTIASTSAEQANVAGSGTSHTVKATQTAQSEAHNTLPKVLLVLLIMLIVAKLGGDLLERIGQPAVLGELIFGILLGNLALLHIPGIGDFLNRLLHDPEVLIFITVLSEIGVILLLFEVGLESTVREMVSVGLSSFVVAVLGVVAPIGLGFLVGNWFLPHESWTVHLFLGAVMAATSVGITARVLRDLHQMERREAKIILGAAVIDDILGLVVLAVAQGVVIANNEGRTLAVGSIVLIIAKAVGFFICAIVVGVLVSRRLYHAATYLRVQGVLLSLTLGWCFLVAYVGTLVGVAPIVGAFAAGLVLEDATFEDWHGREAQLEDLLRPITAFLVPVFFVYTGMNVHLEYFANPAILGFAGALTFCAIIGKQICAFGVRAKGGLNRLAIGIGMVPRGEVGLIVATVGRSMKTADGHPVISDNTFAATVIMVVVTTMITPPALKWAFNRPPKSDSPLASPAK